MGFYFYFLQNVQGNVKNSFLINRNEIYGNKMSAPMGQKQSKHY